MVFITQLIYILDGQEAVFDQFEDIAIPAISKYKGRLLFRIRPGKEAFIESTIAQPYEIHLVEFETENDFANYLQDEEKEAFFAFEGTIHKIGFSYKRDKVLRIK